MLNGIHVCASMWRVIGKTDASGIHMICERKFDNAREYVEEQGKIIKGLILILIKQTWPCCS
jgi:hypothetical protein